MLVSPDTGEINFEFHSLIMLQAMRDQLGPIHLNSGFRSRLYNAQIPNSSPFSMHWQIIAFDLRLAGYNRHSVKQTALDVGFTGIGMYSTFLHVDRGARREWYGSVQAKKIWTENPEIVL